MFKGGYISLHTKFSAQFVTRFQRFIQKHHRIPQQVLLGGRRHSKVK